MKALIRSIGNNDGQGAEKMRASDTADALYALLVNSSDPSHAAA